MDDYGKTIERFVDVQMKRRKAAMPLPIPHADMPICDLITLYSMGHIVKTNENRMWRYEDWRHEDKTAFIESIFAGIPIPPLCFQQRSGRDTEYNIIDGEQRLTALSEFMSNKLKLSETPLRKNLEGKVFKDLSMTAKERLKYTRLTVNVLPAECSSGYLYQVWDRLNPEREYIDDGC